MIKLLNGISLLLGSTLVLATVGCNKNDIVYTEVITPANLSIASVEAAPSGYCSSVAVVNQAYVYENASNQPANSTDGNYNDSELQVTLSNWNIFDETNGQYMYGSNFSGNTFAPSFPTVYAKNYNSSVQFDLPYNPNYALLYLLGATDFNGTLSVQIQNLSGSLASDTLTYTITPGGNNASEGICGSLVTYVVQNAGNTTNYDPGLSMARPSQQQNSSLFTETSYQEQSVAEASAAPEAYNAELDIHTPTGTKHNLFMTAAVYNARKEILAEQGLTVSPDKKSLLKNGAVVSLSKEEMRKLHFAASERISKVRKAINEVIQDIQHGNPQTLKPVLSAGFNELSQRYHSRSKALIVSNIKSKITDAGVYNENIGKFLDTLASKLK